jgi:hypothetical protein
MNLAERIKIVPVLRYGDLNAGATLDTDSINMKNFSRATFLIQWHAIGVADSTLRVYSGATDGAATTALTFHHAKGGAAQGSASCDVLAADASSAALTIANATEDNFLQIIEVDAADMDTANSHNWLTLRISDDVGGGGQTGNVTIIAVLQPRYTGNVSATAL